MKNPSVVNFSAGPAILPQEVLHEAAQAVQNFDNLGLSILEISHRSKSFAAVLERGEKVVRELLSLTDDYAVVFLTGGASTQFFMAPMNLLPENGTASYVDTGSWSAKAIKEVVNFGNHKVLASSKDQNYDHIPKGYEIPEDSAYLHLTSNNTIFGTQYQSFPETKVPIVCDMSSDIFSRPIDINKFGLIYAGAQKNIGPAGVTLVIVRKDLLGKVERKIPTMLNYNTHISKGSTFNTPPVYPIYVSTLTMEWILKNGGLEAMHKRNTEKADLLYKEIDRNSLFQGIAKAEDRSHMNVTFVLKDEAHAANFLKLCEEAKLSGLKGHRSVGGFRASIYNAMPLEGVQRLIDVMKSFEQSVA